MDTNTIMTLIGSLGFPIVMCIAMMYYGYKILAQIKTAIDDLTKTITALNGRIDKMESVHYKMKGE